MKHLLSSITMTCTVVVLLALASCKKTNPPSLSDQIVGKWTMVTAIGNYTVQGYNHKDTTAFTANDYFDFRSDGTLSIMETEKAYNGKWKITGTKLIITETGYMDYGNGFDLPILTKTDLQIYYTDTTSQSTLELKLNLKK